MGVPKVQKERKQSIDGQKQDQAYALHHLHWF